MFPAFLLAMREGLEATLIVGIVLGVLKRMNRPDLRSSVWIGTFSAVVVSLVVGGILTVIGVSLEGPAEQIFEGFTMLLAAGILTWMVFWMNRQGRYLREGMESEVHKAVTKRSSRRALFGLAFLAIVREGIELALFLTATTFVDYQGQFLLGALIGLSAAILLGWLLFSATIRLDVRRFFQVTGVLLILFAAGLVAHGVHEFNEAGWIPAIIEHVWDINPLVDENSLPGLLLKTLFGYNANPSLTEVVAYLAYFMLVFLGLQRNTRAAAKVVPDVSQPS